MRAQLLGYAACIYVLYVSQGLVFEDLHSRQFATPGSDPQKWSFPDGLLLFTISGNIFVAFVMRWWKKPPPNQVGQKYFAALSVPMFLAAGLTFMSMSRVDYPTVSLFKSAKPLAVLIVAALACQHHVYSSKQKIMVGFVSFGLALFFLSKEGLKFDPHSQEGFSLASRLLGYACLLGALGFDGFSALVANRISRLPHPASQYDMQLYVNAWSLGIVFVYMTVTGRVLQLVSFLQVFPQALWLVGSLAALSGVGQLFIFGTLTTFDPLALSIVTTTRKVFTILVSALIYNHTLKVGQWVGIIVLFVGLLWSDALELLKTYVFKRGFSDAAGKESVEYNV